MGTLGLLVLASATASSGSQSSPAPPKVVDIVAERFAFTPSHITVDQGAVLELRITSDDTSHGFRLVGPGEVDVEIPKRGRGDVRVTFDAKEPGDYVFECSRVCGAGHNFMRGTIRVRPAASAEQPSAAR
jgi:heme/copper-type cytochrome/quinol oxidase subunit 2